MLFPASSHPTRALLNSPRGQMWPAWGLGTELLPLHLPKDVTWSLKWLFADILCLLFEYGQYLISYSHVSLLLEINDLKIHQTLREVRSPQLSVLNPCPCTPPVLSSLMRVQVLVWTLCVTSSYVNTPVISFPVPSVTGSCIFSNLWPPFPYPPSQMSLQMLCPFCFENLFFLVSRKHQLASEVLLYQKTGYIIKRIHLH